MGSARLPGRCCQQHARGATESSFRGHSARHWCRHRSLLQCAWPSHLSKPALVPASHAHLLVPSGPHLHGSWCGSLHRGEGLLQHVPTPRRLGFVVLARLRQVPRAVDRRGRDPRRPRLVFGCTTFRFRPCLAQPRLSPGPVLADSSCHTKQHLHVHTQCTWASARVCGTWCFAMAGPLDTWPNAGVVAEHAVGHCYSKQLNMLRHCCCKVDRKHTCCAQLSSTILIVVSTAVVLFLSLGVPLQTQALPPRGTWCCLIRSLTQTSTLSTISLMDTVLVVRYCDTVDAMSGTSGVVGYTRPVGSS